MTDPRYRLKTLARNLRKNQTDAEKLLLNLVRNRQLAGCKFRRQVPIGSFIVDIVCLSHNLIIKLDGGQHAKAETSDTDRSSFLEEQGFRVLRFWNHEVLENTEAVMQKIYEVVEEDKV